MQAKSNSTLGEASALRSRRCYSTWEGRYYMALYPPQPDSEELAEIGERLMIRHGSYTAPETKVFTAPKGVLTAGWVLGIFEP